MNNVKLKFSSDTCCYWVVGERNSKNYPTLTVAPNSPDLNAVDYIMWGLLQEVYKIHITDLDELKQRLRMSGSSWIMLSLRQPFVSGVVDRSRSVMPVLYTFSCNISHAVINLTQI